METFENLKNRLALTEQDRLMLETVPMLLMPRWFFVAIKKQIESLAGKEIARKVYYEAGYEGAAKWAQTQMKEAGLSGRAVMEQYLASASVRGWGRFEILDFDQERGYGRFRIHHSAVAEETGTAKEVVCDHLPGSLAGAFQTILDHARVRRQVKGRELKCISNEDRFCEFVVESKEE
ncbi:MAG: 4-vinyl reductase [Desulfobacterales bacterium]|nr:MAG: 4-vinyl reductase [Desulfobacterales bacterium]